MGGLASSAFTKEALAAAWNEILENDAADDQLSHGVERFQQEADARLTRLAESLASWVAAAPDDEDADSYRPGELTLVELTIGDKVRTLHIPTVDDRVVARALLAAATPLVDPHLGSAAYAYRPGLGVADAVQTLAAWRDEGLGWVARTDIDDCFPTIPSDLAFRRVDALLLDDVASGIVGALLDRTFWQGGRRRRMSGLAQGCPLSPMLANLALLDVDAALNRAGFPAIRYGDDLAIAAASEDEAREALRVASAAVEELGMQLGADKTEVTSFDQGFTYLGEDFGPRYPPAMEGLRVQEPDEKVLYVGLQGGRIRIKDGRVIVESAEDAEVLDVPTSQVTRIVCFGSVGLSAGVRSWALANDVEVVLASRSGNYLGTILSHEDRYRPARLRAQLAASDSPRALEIGKAIVSDKLPLLKDRGFIEASCFPCSGTLGSCFPC